jgi:predicted transcriptional regulator of viral defense system
MGDLLQRDQTTGREVEFLKKIYLMASKMGKVEKVNRGIYYIFFLSRLSTGYFSFMLVLITSTQSISVFFSSALSLALA